MKNIKYFFDTIFSKAYWQYILFSKTGIESILSIFGFAYLLIEALDFFGIFKRDEYASYAFFFILLLSIILSIAFRRPVKSIMINFSKYDFRIEVRIADLFDVDAAIVISTNTKFEADVAGGKISAYSLQGQFTAKYFTGNQNELINDIENELKKLKMPIPYDMGTVVPISTHGKMFYFTAMSELNEQGNAFTTAENVNSMLQGLWKYVKESGDLQSLALPIIGTGRGRLQISRKKMIAMIADSFCKASIENKFTEKLIIVVRPDDACKFGVNLYDIKDHLKHILFS